jgi:hypothetical protein
MHAKTSAGDGKNSSTAASPPASPATAGSDRETDLWLKRHIKQHETLCFAHLSDDRHLIKKPRS